MANCKFPNTCNKQRQQKYESWGVKGVHTNVLTLGTMLYTWAKCLQDLHFVRILQTNEYGVCVYAANVVVL
jgi:hypothetical protein